MELNMDESFVPDFELVLQQTKGPLKHRTPFVYSEVLQTIFVGRDEECKMKFRLKFPSEKWPLYRLRAKLSYSDIEYQNHPVERCEVCKSKKSDHPNHVLCEFYKKSPNMKHEEHEGHCSVVIHQLPPAPGNIIEASFKFQCLSSCFKIKNKKMNMVFSLETQCGREVASQFVRVKVLCLPGQAAMKAEEKIAAHDQQQVMPREDDIGERAKAIRPPTKILDEEEKTAGQILVKGGKRKREEDIIERPQIPGLPAKDLEEVQTHPLDLSISAPRPRLDFTTERGRLNK